MNEIKKLADPKVRQAYSYYQIFITLIKLDFFAVLSYSIAFIILVFRDKPTEFIIGVVFIPVIMIVFLLAIGGVILTKSYNELKLENRNLFYLFFIGMVIALAYMTFNISTANLKVYPPVMQQFVILFTAIALFLISCTMISGYLCLKLFHKGYFITIFSKSKSHSETTQVITSN